MVYIGIIGTRNTFTNTVQGNFEIFPFPLGSNFDFVTCSFGNNVYIKTFQIITLYYLII